MAAFRLACASLTKRLLGFSRVIPSTRRCRVDRVQGDGWARSCLGGSLRASQPVGPHGISWAAKKARRFSFTRWANMQMLSSLGRFGGVFWA
jgi:hypothetical protein